MKKAYFSIYKQLWQWEENYNSYSGKHKSQVFWNVQQETLLLGLLDP